MKKLSDESSIPNTILAILYQLGEGTIKSFFPHPYYHTFCNHKRQGSIYISINRLKTRGLIKADSQSDIFRLTKKGEKEAFLAYTNAERKKYKLIKPKWDGKWRMILFDIPEKKRKYRDYLRELIKFLDFKELQKSVWVSPYPIPDYLRQILAEERILYHTRMITTSSIDYDKDLRKLFSV